jgi:hypothetical protein
MTLERHVSVAFTIDSVDIFLKNGPILLSLHLSQNDIDIDVLFRSTIREISNTNTALGKKGHALGKKFFSMSLSTLLNKNGLKILCGASTAFFLVLLCPCLILIQKKYPNPYNPRICPGI